jgi:hypothetical protein
LQPDRASVNLYFGMSGTGKTCAALSDIAIAPAIIFDINQQERLARNAAVCWNPLELISAIEKKSRRICWRGFEKMGADAFEYANMVAWKVGSYSVFWDEVDMMMAPAHVPGYAYRIINAGRHRGIAIYATARRPAAMSRHLTAASTRALSFRVIGVTDGDYLRRQFFPDLGRGLPSLKPGHALISDAQGERLKKIF